mmetsp:Transcript_51471/g.164598  ORF Transcript_51471/g.164598 Transcript_51471/m.164598 type:complete len:247 (-) Transcript_51471:146-886(-)
MDLLQVRHLAGLVVDAFHHKEAAVERLGCALPVPRPHLLQHSPQVLHVVVLEVHHRAAAQGQPVLDGVAHALVTYDEVAFLGEGGDHAGGGGHIVRVEDGLLHPHELRNLLLQVQVHINCPIEPARATGPAAVLLQGPRGSVLDRLLLREPEVVEGGEVEEPLPIRLHIRAGGAGDYGDVRLLVVLEGGAERLGLPLLAQLIHLLFAQRLVLARLVALLEEQEGNHCQEDRLHQQSDVQGLDSPVV